MNIYHNILPIALALCILPGCSHSSDEEKSLISNREDQCDYAMRGELDINKDKSENSERNSYLFNCSIAIIVPLPNESKTESPRYCRRLIFLRGLANEQTTRIFKRST